MNSSQQVDEKITGYACPVILKVTPAEKTARVPGPFGRGALKLVPVTGLRIGISRNRVLPSSNGSITIKPSLHGVQLSNGFGLKKFPRFLVNQRTAVLAANLKNFTGFCLRLND